MPATRKSARTGLWIGAFVLALVVAGCSGTEGTGGPGDPSTESPAPVEDVTIDTGMPEDVTTEDSTTPDPMREGTAGESPIEGRTGESPIQSRTIEGMSEDPTSEGMVR